MIGYTISNNNLHLVDSYKLRKKEFEPTLEEIEHISPGYDVWNRSKRSMSLEIATHNFCYSIGLWKSRTGSCDLNYPQSFIERVAYSICGRIAWLFIK